MKSFNQVKQLISNESTQAVQSVQIRSHKHAQVIQPVHIRCYFCQYAFQGVCNLSIIRLWYQSFILSRKQLKPLAMMLSTHISLAIHSLVFWLAN
jgi:hypothetical protein